MVTPIKSGCSSVNQCTVQLCKMAFVEPTQAQQQSEQHHKCISMQLAAAAATTTHHEQSEDAAAGPKDAAVTATHHEHPKDASASPKDAATALEDATLEEDHLQNAAQHGLPQSPAEHIKQHCQLEPAGISIPSACGALIG